MTTEMGISDISAANNKMLTESVGKLQKVCLSLIDLYTSMHSVLINQLQKQLSFDSQAYTRSLSALLDNIYNEKSRIEEEIYGLRVVHGPAMTNDLVKLIIETSCAADNPVAISNRNIGGSWYTLGKNQLLDFIERALIGHNTGDFIKVTNEENMVQYTIEIVQIKRTGGQP